MTENHLFQLEQQFINRLAQKKLSPIEEMQPQEARQMLRELQNDGSITSDVSMQYVEVELDKGRKLPILLIFPQNTSVPLAMIYYVHGGGWVMGDELTHRKLLTTLAKSVPAVIAMPLYTHAPERQFPFLLDDLYKGLHFMESHAAFYNILHKNIVVMGDSAGGNMATILTFMAKERGFSPSICLQVLLYPVTAADFDSESYWQFCDGPWLTRAAMQWFWDMYLPDKEKRNHKEASPLQALLEDLSCLPPALVITAENDVLCSEGEAYARRLDAAGVPVASVRFNGTMHDFLMLNALHDTPATQAAMALIVAQLRQFLYGVK